MAGDSPWRRESPRSGLLEAGAPGYAQHRDKTIDRLKRARERLSRGRTHVGYSDATARPGLTDSGLSHHALCPINSPDSKRKAARQTQRRLTGQHLENPIQSLGEMGLEQNLKQPVAANWGAAAQRKASKLWSASTARWKRWSLGLKQKKGGGGRGTPLP